jgi:predicted nucleic acid-binding protein
MRVLLDTNIVLDVLLDRIPWRTEAVSILEAVRAGRIVCAVSSTTIINVFYVGRRHVGVERAREIVELCLAALEILPVDRRTLEDAARLNGTDFEDNVQIASAVIGGVDGIVTRDSEGFTASSIRVLSPGELVALLSPRE